MQSKLWRQLTSVFLSIILVFSSFPNFVSAQNNAEVQETKDEVTEKSEEKVGGDDENKEKKEGETEEKKKVDEKEKVDEKNKETEDKKEKDNKTIKEDKDEEITKKKEDKNKEVKEKKEDKKDSKSERAPPENKEYKPGDIYFTVPKEATLFIGTKKNHFTAFEEEEPKDYEDNEDGTRTYFYELNNNGTYNYRVSQEGKLTNVGKFTASDKNKEMEVTAEDLDAFESTAILNKGTNIEGNIYLNINEQNHLKLDEGESFNLLTLRNWQALIEGIENYYFEPDFHFDVLSGENVVEIEKGEPGSYSKVIGKEEGTAIVQVTYDALKVHDSAYQNGDFSAIWPENVGLFVVTVGKDKDTGIETGIESNKERNKDSSTSLQKGILDAEIDSVYFDEEDEGALYTFTPTKGAEVEVLHPNVDHSNGTVSYDSFTTDGVTKKNNDFTVLLKEGRNVVRVSKDGKEEYHVITARPLGIDVENKSNPGKEINAGDEVQVTFNGLSFPAQKLAGIYNFNAQLVFTTEDGQEVRGDKKQYNITTEANSVTFTVPDEHEGKFALHDGHIQLGFFGSPIGSHRNIDVETGANPNLNASQVDASYSIFPEITIMGGAEEEKTNTSKLKELIEKAKNESLENKTDDSKKNFQKALEEAEKILADENSTQEEIDEAYKTLNEAINNLEEEVDKSKLKQMVDKAKEIDLENKTEDSKNDFEKALVEAEEVLEEINATQNEIDNAIQKLEKAIDNLKERAPPTDEKVTVNVRVEGYGKTLLEPTKVEVEPFDLSPYDSSVNEIAKEPRAIHAIIKALDTIEGFDTTDRNQFVLGSGGNYISKVGEDSEFSAGDGSGWMYAVNNDEPNVGVGAYKLEDGDSIVLYFVEDFLDNLYTYFQKDEYEVEPGKETTIRLIGKGDYVSTSTEGSYLLVDGERYTIDGKEVQFDKNGEATVRFKDIGNYTLSAERYNKDGQLNIVKPYAIVKVAEEIDDTDVTPPNIVVEGIKDKETVFDATLSFVVRAIDDVDGTIDPSVKFNNETIQMDKSNKYKVNLQEGKNTITVEAIDNAGNKAEKTYTVYYEKPKVDKSIEQSLDQLVAYIQKNKLNSDWIMIGLSQLGEKLPASFEKEFGKEIKEQVIDALKNDRLLITDVERLVLTSLALNIDPTDIEGLNLIELIYDSPERTLYDGEVVDTLTYQGNNGIAFALIALDAAEFDVPNDAKWTREKLVGELLANQNKDGSWSLSKNYDGSSIDITAMVLTALAPYKNSEDVSKAVEEGFAFLSTEQKDHGGFDGGKEVGGVNSEAASQVIIALTANGMDPTGEMFTKDVNILDHLLSYQLKDGSFTHVPGEKEGNNIATEQALLALTSYKMFIEEGKYVYQFGNVNDLDLESKENLVPKTSQNSNDEGNSSTNKGESADEGAVNNSGYITDIAPGSDEFENAVENEEETSGNDSLPKTATNIYNILFIGLGLLVLGILLYMTRKLKVER